LKIAVAHKEKTPFGNPVVLQHFGDFNAVTRAKRFVGKISLHSDE
jgi:hypothetical protein